MKYNPSIIQYIALLGKRDYLFDNGLAWLNVPQKSITHPMLSYIGKLPQHMMQFIYGCEYYESLLCNGLQIGYKVIYVYPDSLETIGHLDFSLPSVNVFLISTDDYSLASSFRQAIVKYADKNVFSIVPYGTKAKWNLPGVVADNADEVFKAFYNISIDLFNIDYKRIPFSIPIIIKNFYDMGNHFSPTRVNTMTSNSMVGNWNYSIALSTNDYIKGISESSKKAFANKDGFDRQNLLLDQIAKMYALHNRTIKAMSDGKGLPDQQLPPLVIAAPYISKEMTLPVIPKDFTSEEDIKKAKLLHKVMNVFYTHNYTIDVNAKQDEREDMLTIYPTLQQNLLEPHMNFLDMVSSLNCSIMFSPYLRLPLMGSNINAELSYVGIVGLNKLVRSQKTIRNIRKVMEKVGKKITNAALSPKAVTLFKRVPCQIVAITDLPIEWTMIDGVPLGFTHDVCRLPETPIPSLLAQYEECTWTPYTIPKDILEKTLVVFGNEDPSFVKAQESIVILQKKKHFHIRKCLTINELKDSVEEIKPQLLILDCHGNVDAASHQSYLMLGEEKLTGDDVVKMRIACPLVFLSACNTYTTYNTVSTIANAFFQAGASSVITSYMPLNVYEGTKLYSRLLNNLDYASKNCVHRNWLAFMSHLQRTSYIQSIIEIAMEKGIKLSNDDLNILSLATSASMIFQKRRELYNELNISPLAKKYNISYDNVIPHYLMYSVIGRADLIRFESYLEDKGIQIDSTKAFVLHETHNK